VPSGKLPTRLIEVIRQNITINNDRYIHARAGFLQGVLGTRFVSLELKIGSLELEKLIIGSLESEKIGSLESEKSGPYKSKPGIQHFP